MTPLGTRCLAFSSSIPLLESLNQPLLRGEAGFWILLHPDWREEKKMMIWPRTEFALEGKIDFSKSWDTVDELAFQYHFLYEDTFSVVYALPIATVASRNEEIIIFNFLIFFFRQQRMTEEMLKSNFIPKGCLIFFLTFLHILAWGSDILWPFNFKSVREMAHRHSYQY